MNPVNKFLDNLFARRRWSIHLLFWLAILLLYAVFFGRQNNNYAQTFFFVGLLMPVTIGLTYFFNYFLIPRYLITGRYPAFILYSLYALLTALFLAMMVVLLTFMVMARVHIHQMDPASLDIFFLLTSLLMVVFLAAAIKMVNHWRKSKEEYQQLMRERVETELKLLKAQLNPHFLFNTLNNLYYLTTQKSDRAPQAVLQLSEILDYVLHAGKSDFVPLPSELHQVNNYIALEMLRYEGRVTLKEHVEGDLQKYQIPPMTLVGLVENAFKHGVMPLAAGAWIRLSVHAAEDSLRVSVCNSRKQGPVNPGVGLANLTSQLSLLYGPNHTLRIEQHNDEFLVNLTLKS